MGPSKGLGVVCERDSPEQAGASPHGVNWKEGSSQKPIPKSLQGPLWGSWGEGPEGWAAAPSLLPTPLPHSCSFTAGPTLQAHKGEAHCKQLLFMWKPLD